MEVDGDIHDLQKEEDERREKALSARWDCGLVLSLSKPCQIRE
jgi:very-short-patch-repair endonuclease